MAGPPLTLAGEKSVPNRSIGRSGKENESPSQDENDLDNRQDRCICNGLTAFLAMDSHQQLPDGQRRFRIVQVHLDGNVI